MTSSNPANLFSFEAEEYSDLNWMPMAFRYRLDVCGLKLSLAAWQKLPLSERLALLNQSCECEGERLDWALRLRSALEACDFKEAIGALDPWTDPKEIPEDVRQKLSEFGFEHAIKWLSLMPVQRYVLCKLTRSRQANKYLPLAAAEFR